MTPCPAGPGVTHALIQYEQSPGRASREGTAAWGIWETSLKPTVYLFRIRAQIRGGRNMLSTWGSGVCVLKRSRRMYPG